MVDNNFDFYNKVWKDIYYIVNMYLYYIGIYFVVYMDLFVDIS